MPELTTRTEPPAPSSSSPGRPCPAVLAVCRPLRREGPAKLTGAAKYADDLVFPGAWFGATIRSSDAHARSWRSTSIRPSTGRRSSSSPPPTSRARTSSARSRPTSRSWCRSAARSTITPSHWRCRRAGPGHPRAAAARAHGQDEPLPAVFDPLASDHSFAAYEIGRRRPRMPPSPRPTSSSRASTGSGTRSSCTSRTTR